MKQYAIIYETRGETRSGQILADCDEHALEICEENGWTLVCEIVNGFELAQFSNRVH